MGVILHDGGPVPALLVSAGCGSVPVGAASRRDAVPGCAGGVAAGGRSHGAERGGCGCAGFRGSGVPPRCGAGVGGGSRGRRPLPRGGAGRLRLCGISWERRPAAMRCRGARGESRPEAAPTGRGDCGCAGSRGSGVPPRCGAGVCGGSRGRRPLPQGGAGRLRLCGIAWERRPAAMRCRGGRGESRPEAAPTGRAGRL